MLPDGIEESAAGWPRAAEAILLEGFGEVAVMVFVIAMIFSGERVFAWYER